MNDKQVTKINPITAILILIVIAIPTVLILSRTNQVSSPVNTPTSRENLELDLIPIESTDLIVFGDIKVELPDGWTNLARLSSQTNTEYECVGATTCQFGIVSDNSGLIDGATIGYVNLAKELTPVYVDPSKYPVNIFGDEEVLSADRAVMLSEFDIEDEEATGQESVSDTIVQISGCFKNNLCVSSGILDIDSQEVNNQSVTKFRELLEGIRLVTN